MNARYPVGGPLLGQSRELSAEEIDRARHLHREAPRTPPWTAERLAKSRERDAYVVWLFEDGCSKHAIGEALGLGDLAGDCQAGVSKMLQRAYERGQGTRTRRYIGSLSQHCEPAFRELSDSEKADLLALRDSCPLHWGKRSTTGSSVESIAFRTYVRNLRSSGVTLRAIGDVLGVTREWIRRIADTADAGVTHDVAVSA